MTTFQGFTVLEIEPNGETQAPDTFQRSIVNLDGGIGKIWVEDRGSSPVMNHVFDWWMESRSDIANFKTFILGQLGRLTPFWVPSWNQDLTLTGAVNSSDTSITIAWCGYTQFQFANKARRYLAIIPYQSGIVNSYLKITASQDNGKGRKHSLSPELLERHIQWAHSSLRSWRSFASLRMISSSNGRTRASPMPFLNFKSYPRNTHDLRSARDLPIFRRASRALLVRE